MRVLLECPITANIADLRGELKLISIRERILELHVLFGRRSTRDNRNIRPTRCLKIALERAIRELPRVGNIYDMIKNGITG